MERVAEMVGVLESVGVLKFLGFSCSAAHDLTVSSCSQVLGWNPAPRGKAPHSLNHPKLTCTPLTSSPFVSRTLAEERERRRRMERRANREIAEGGGILREAFGEGEESRVGVRREKRVRE